MGSQKLWKWLAEHDIPFCVQQIFRIMYEKLREVLRKFVIFLLDTKLIIPGEHESFPPFTVLFAIIIKSREIGQTRESFD